MGRSDSIQSIQSISLSYHAAFAHRSSSPIPASYHTHRRSQPSQSILPMADAGNGGAIAAAKNLGDIEISPQDDRGYRAIGLPNGLQVRGLCGLDGMCGLCAIDRHRVENIERVTSHNRRCWSTTRRRTRRRRRWTWGWARSSTGTWRAARTSASTCSSWVGWVGWDG